MNETAEFNVAVIDYPQTPIAVMEHRGSPNLLGSTIHQFIAWRKRNHLPPGQSKTFNLLYDDPSVTEPDNFRFDIGCSVDHPVKENDYGVVNKVIPAGKCAVVRHIGSDDGMGAAVHYLYSTWLRDSGFELRDFPIFLERVSFFPDVPEKDMITDIYLPIH
ncbi:GyrI-like domain-containing protein [Lacimicrobium sp. SS2-24]|uniref:AraC family transcriptional regulator n=1 Tax=Lacimicrobium sp. SS2-24 TaxID=2005569 RepID=UPI001FEED154|nr:GyrI-like domain-containing protein [Lacimicrobium sp. SS2-24]